MGLAAGIARHAASIFKDSSKYIDKIPPSYKAAYTEKSNQAAKLDQMATEKAESVFFERIPKHDDPKIQFPDPKNFVKFDESIRAELEKVAIINEVLRHVVPPEVRKMQVELKTQIQNMID